MNEVKRVNVRKGARRKPSGNDIVADEYTRLLELAKVKGVVGTGEQDAFAVAMMRVRRGAASNIKFDGLFPKVTELGTLERWPWGVQV